MLSARHALVGLAVTAALTGCGMEVGQPTGSVDAGRSAGAPTLPSQTSPTATGSSLSDGARVPAQAGVHLGVDRAQLSTARQAARAFFTSYVAYLYGQLPVGRVVDLSPSLRHQLDSERAESTPAEIAARARITHVSVVIGRDQASVVAVGVVKAGGGVSELTATLQPTGLTWSVVAVAG